MEGVHSMRKRIKKLGAILHDELRKRDNLLVLFTTVIVILILTGVYSVYTEDDERRQITVGFVYVDDASTAYTGNFIKGQTAIENLFTRDIKTIERYNVPEGGEQAVLQELVDAGCELIFTTSYGYSKGTKEFAAKHPQVQFCQATGDNANDAPIVENYHTFMGEIYQGRYVTGVVAGRKLQSLIEEGFLTKEQAKVGYIGAYPYPEVISGYTAFLLGVRSVVPTAVMTVRYTNTWNNYMLEKKCAKELIDEGCVIISQHSDTAGPAVACEETDSSQTVYMVGYNHSMVDVAPTTYLTGCKINWAPYMEAAVRAVMNHKPIEEYVKGQVWGQDASGGFVEGWVEMLELNRSVATIGAQEIVDETVEALKNDEIQVFKGDYIGVNPNDENDTYDLTAGFEENANSSAPAFGYILKDVIEIK